MCMYVSVCKYADVGIPGGRTTALGPLQLTGTCEPPVMSAGN